MILKNIESLLNQGKFQQAIATLQSLLLTNPNNADLYRVLGLAYKAIKDYKHAIDNLTHSIQLNNRQAGVLQAVADIYKQQGSDALAIDYYQQACVIDSRNYNYLNSLGFLFIKKELYQKSIDCFNKSLALNAQQMNAKIGIASVFTIQNKDIKAIEYLLDVLKVEPNNFVALNNLALCYKKNNNLSQAIHYFNQANNVRPNQENIIENLSFLYLANNQADLAIDTLQRALMINPYSLKLNSALANILWEQKRENFLIYYQALNTSSMPFNLLLDYFYKLLKSDQIDAASSILTKIMEKFPNYEHSLLAQYHCWYALGEHKKAYIYLNKIMRDKKLSKEELDWYGRHSLALGKFEEAVDIYQRLVQEWPENQGYWCLLTTALREVDYNAYKELCCYDDVVFIVDIKPPSEFENIEAFNQCLLDELKYSHVTKRQPLDQSLVGGTQTLGRIFDKESLLLGQFRILLENEVKNKVATIDKDISHPTKLYADSTFKFSGAWSVWLKSAGYHKDHYHSEGWYSGVYYIQTPDSTELIEGAGYLKFGEADLKLPQKSGADFYIKPKAGQLVIFPSFIWHGTVPFVSTKPRVSIAFDIVPTELKKK